MPGVLLWDTPLHLCFTCVPVGWRWKLAALFRPFSGPFQALLRPFSGPSQALLAISSITCQQQVIDRRERSVAYQKEIIQQCLGLSWIVLMRFGIDLEFKPFGSFWGVYSLTLFTMQLPASSLQVRCVAPRGNTTQDGMEGSPA